MPHPRAKYFFKKSLEKFWLEETAILDMQMSKLPMIQGKTVSPNTTIQYS
jgi:hypothetical protein